MGWCCLVGLPASGAHTLQVQISLGRWKPTEFQLFLIVAFAVNVLLSQSNDPFFPPATEPMGWAARPRGRMAHRGKRWAAARTPDGPGQSLPFFGFSSYRLLSEAGAAFEKDKLMSSVSIYMLIK